jgi:hypothetical protein
MKQFGREELDEDDINLIHESFWTGIRASLFKKISKGEGGRYQWTYIIGKISRYPDGARISLSDKSIKYLDKIVTYLNSTEGREELLDIGIKEPPEDIDELIGILKFSKNDRTIKKEQFRLFLKHKHKIMKYLLS